jgi:hypothetical protein
LKKNDTGRTELTEIFHKSVINDIVVGLSFADKVEEEYDENVKVMYLYEAKYYFVQAFEKIKDMEIFDDDQNYNSDLVEEIGYETFLTTLIVFREGVKHVKGKLPNKRVPEYSQIEEIDSAIDLHISILKKDYNNKS